nr:hypothetical protein [uncultured Halomonas sp.]
MKHSVQNSGDGGRALGERSAILVELLGNIEQARLLEVLDEEALSVTDSVIDELARNVSDQADLPIEHYSKSISSKAEAMIKRFDEERSANDSQGVRGVKASGSNPELTNRVDSLRILLRYRRKIEDARQKHNA